MSEATQSARTYYLVDGSGFIFRAFHTIPMRIRKADGAPTNAVYGFAAMLMKLLDDLKADHIAVIFDASEKTFRNDLYEDYKANRDAPPEELVPQFPLIRDAVAAFGLPCVELKGWEADDIIATYARQAREAGDSAVVVSSDKDLMQLVDDRVTMFDPMKNKPIDIASVEERFGVPPSGVVDVQALAGDSVDNVPGVPGIGVKTAAQLINEYGDLDTLLARADGIKQPKRRQNLIDHADMARLSRSLVRLADDVPVPMPLEDLVPNPDADRLVSFLDGMEFPSLVNRVRSRFGIEAAPEAADKAAPGPVTRDYATVQDEQALADWINRATEAGVVAIDTETTSLNASQATLVGVSLAVAPGQACYIPLGHCGAAGDGALQLGDADAAPKQIPLARAIELLKPLLEDPSVLKVGQNLKYDWQILARQDPPIHIAPSDDTMLLSYSLDGGAHGHGTGRLGQSAFGRVDHQIRRDHRHRQSADHLRPRPPGQGDRLRRRRCGHHPAPLPHVEAAAGA